ncbi:protein-tyrosine-phosphatase [Paenibacillus agaridevorans]|jgi:protein-tyrosine phosphatase|uniref:Protein-tyrosine-phosphatase n=1 Tax=Paenibacillus agaridevorans TaxID=171404 RepID=A0A2R5EPG6_9BACL|nr:tyrosine-protein phosphatase [Paenibacillus agaridevorans]GBG08572.1 protein-tyrosine-phosphatase [Paenibacillus agaridevorans]
MTNELMPACLLPLQGVYNFRDMGGLRTTDGRTVKQGLLFRAAELTGLTPDDHLALEGIGLKHVFDYRNRAEAEKKPDPQIGQAVNLRVPANAGAEDQPDLDLAQMFAQGLHKQFSKDMLDRLYTDLPIRNASYKQLMELLKSPASNLPLVHHCAGGRDRTGIGSMLILLTLGVPYETVMEDYLLSNVTLAGFHRHMFDIAAQYVSMDDLREIEAAMKLQERYLNASRNRIDQEYGTFERYLEAEFGIDDEVRQHIQAYCLE